MSKESEQLRQKDKEYIHSLKVQLTSLLYNHPPNSSKQAMHSTLCILEGAASYIAAELMAAVDEEYIDVEDFAHRKLNIYKGYLDTATKLATKIISEAQDIKDPFAKKTHNEKLYEEIMKEIQKEIQ